MLREVGSVLRTGRGRSPEWPTGKLSQAERELLKCRLCGTYWIPDLDAVIDGTDKWDNHTYMAACKCEKPEFRLCIG